MSRLALCLLALTLVACSDSHSSDDAGGIVILMDAGPGTMGDAGGGTDAGPPIMFDAGAGSDAGPGVMGDAGAPTDGGGTVGIECMGMTCDSATQQCCISGGAGGGAMAACIPAGEMCMGAAVDCDGPEDCAGNVCCARASLAGVTVMCDPDPSTCGAGGFGEFELCHTPADCSGPTDMCCPINMFGISAMYCSEMCFGTMP